MKLLNYIKSIIIAIYNLLQGLYITMLNMLRPKVTEQYPENRETKVNFERFRGMLTMPHNEKNEHKCTACGICMMNCPNGTIRVTGKKVTDETTGSEKKVLDCYIYDVGSCTFCAICTSSCPRDAIEWSNHFEHSLFTRSKLEKKLNREGSQLETKSKE